MAESRDDYIDPQPNSSSTLSKGIWQAVSSLGLFVVGQALATKGIKGASKTLFKSLAVAGKEAHIRKASRYALDNHGGSITAFLSKTKSSLQPLASSIHGYSSNRIAVATQTKWKEQELSAYSKFQDLKKYAGVTKGSELFSRNGVQSLIKSDFSPIINKIGADYLKETALNLPLFYGMATYAGYTQAETPAWYNLPGHVVGMAKFAPEYFLFDGVFRGGSKLFGVAKGAIGARIGEFLPDPIKTGVTSAVSKLQSGEYLGKRIGGLTLGHYTSKAKASASAFADSWGPNRKKYWTQITNTLSRYKQTNNSFADLVQDKGAVYKERRKEYLGIQLERVRTRALQHNLKSEEAADHFFRSTINTLREDMTRIAERGIDWNKGGMPIDLLNKAYFHKDKNLPFLAKLLGLRRARGKDFGGDESISKLFITGDGKDIYNIFSKQSNGQFLGKSRTDFFDNIIANHAYIRKTGGPVVDLHKVSPKYLLNKLAHAKPLVLFGKVSLGDLLGLKVFSSRTSDLPRIIPIKGPVAIDESNILSGKGTQLNEHGLWVPARQGNQPGTAMLARYPGKKGYSLYDFDRAADPATAWTEIARNINTKTVSDSSKLARVFIRNSITTEGPLNREIGYSMNPVVKFMQKHLSLLDGTGETASVFQLARTFLPNKFNDILSPGANKYNEMRSVDVLRNIRKTVELSKQKGYSSSSHYLNNINAIASRINKLGNKASVDSFNKIISDSLFMEDIVDFVIKKGNIKGISSLKAKDVLSDQDKLIDFTRHIITDTRFKGVMSGRSESIEQILSGARLSKGAMDAKGGLQTPENKIKKFIYDFAIDKSSTNTVISSSDNIIDIIKNKLATSSRVKSLIKDGRFGEDDLAELEYALTYQKYRKAINSPMLHDLSPEQLSQQTVEQRAILKNINRPTLIKNILDDLGQKSSFINNGESIIENYEKRINRTQLISSLGGNVLSSVVSDSIAANPVVLYPSGFSGAAKLGMLWSTDTMRKIGEFGGLGWDPYKYKGTDLAKLWGKRVAAFGAASIGYSALDTFVDISGLFDWTMFDEGITVGLADQAVKARMMAGFAYDKLGVDNAARYMEGLMPGSTRVLPGAAVGFYMGGVKGAALGGLLNAAIQPQFAEGPLSFLSILPPLAPFVTDMTKDYSELQDIYEGQELQPQKSGAGWLLGINPMEGGRVETYKPNWYARLKSQYKAGPTLYGSKFEQFIFKDIPFLDISIGDLMDPQYLDWKHAMDRPYSVPSVPFSEVPVVGPLLGSTAGRLYNAIHPLGTNKMHVAAGEKAYSSGTSYDWKGNERSSFGPQFGGFGGTVNSQNTFAGNMGNPQPLLSPHSGRALISEQVYRGIIEPPGLPGFLTSAILWGGDEPFADSPVLASGNTIDSFSRTFWDQNLGDMMGTNEVIRRMIPAKRSSVEEVNFLQNQMPTWMGGDARMGDPYCLTPDTLVETSEGLIRADSIETDMLLKTIQGRYFPVQDLKTREVNEELYKITIQGLESFPIKVTGGHPFYINEKWVFAKDIKITDRLSYPLGDIETSAYYKTSNKDIKINCEFSYALGMLTRWLIGDDLLYLRKETTSRAKQIIEKLLSLVFNTTLKTINKRKDLLSLIKKCQTAGPSLFVLQKDLPVLINYLQPFLVKSETDTNALVFRMHTEKAAYRVWTGLLQNEITSRIEKKDIIIEGPCAVNAAFFLDINLSNITRRNKWPLTENTISINFDSAYYTTKHGSLALLPIQSIEKFHYKGPVYAIDMGEDESFTVPGALVHNSKVAHGELLLPGKGYESFFNPEMTFPVGMSRMGYSPYEQALTMVGLGDFSLETEEILETGSAVHKMIQDQLINAGLATRVEALISDPQLNIRSYVDVMYRDPYSNKELPLEIKSISAMGMAGLRRPKWKHRVQLNSYMAAMNVKRGKFLYVSRDDPGQTKEFSLKFDASLWERTKNDLHEARRLATTFLSEGYGNAANGYSYIDRMRSLLNAAPYSKEFRETDTLLKEQLEEGLLTLQQEEEFSTLQKYHRSMMRKYELYPHRFKVQDLLTPAEEYPEELSSNLFIKPAADYNIVERVLGSAWEYATHLNSPLHSKLIGKYSPEEQYRRNMIRGDFASWTAPIEDFVKPYARGLRSSSDPLQGAISWGTGGSLVAGLPGAVAGATIGAAYGAFNGAYEMLTGNRYTPEEFRDRVDAQNYFDMLNYYKAQQLYEATGDPSYEKQMKRTPYGWINATMSSFWAPQGRMATQGRLQNNPDAQGVGNDRGFGSPWKGIKHAVQVQPGNIRLFRGVRSWVQKNMIKEGKLVGGATQEGTLFTTTSYSKALRYAGDSGFLIEMHIPERVAAKHLYGNSSGFREMQSVSGKINALKLAQGADNRLPLDSIFDEGLSKSYIKKVWSTESIQTKLLKKLNNPSSLNIGPDKGFGSPWQGIDNQQSLDFQTQLIKYTGFGALPSWDRPFWSAFLETPEEKREKLLNTVDDQMSNMLMTAWGRGEEVNLPNPDTFFNTYFKPPALHPVMDPTQDIDDFQVTTLQEEGLDCLLPAELVLTNKGYLPIKDISKGIKVLNGNNEFKSPLHLIKKYKNSEKTYKINFKGMLSPLNITYNHKLEVARKCEQYQFKETTVNQIKKYDRLKLTAIPLLKTLDSYRGIKLDKNFGYIAGWWLAEGSFQKNTINKKPKSLQFSLGISEENHAKTICKILKDKFGGNPSYKIHPEKNYIAVCYHNAKISRLFKEMFNEYSARKIINTQLYNAPYPFLIQMIKSWFDGDGWETDREICVHTNSKSLMESMFLLIRAFGIEVLQQYIKSKPIVNTPYTSKEGYRLRIGKIKDRKKFKTKDWEYSKYTTVSVTNLKCYEYTGYVYDLHMPEYHYYSTKTCTIHNSHDFGMGWRSQLRKIANSPINILPISMTESRSGPAVRGNLGKGELEDVVRKILERMGYKNSTVIINIQNSSANETVIHLNVARAATSKVIEKMYG